MKPTIKAKSSPFFIFLVSIAVIAIGGGAFWWVNRVRNLRPTETELQEIQAGFIQRVTTEVQRLRPKSQSIKIDIQELSAVSKDLLKIRYNLSFVEDLGKPSEAKTIYQAAARLNRRGDYWLTSDVSSNHQEISFENGIEIRMKPVGESR